MVHEKTFYLNGGKTFNTLKTLAKELRDMPGHIYEHHVNEENNDFANWVKFSLKNDNLGKKIEGQINKIELELHVLRHLVFEAQNQPKKELKVKSKKKINVSNKLVKKKSNITSKK